MTPEERKEFVDELAADFRKAKESRSQDVATWMNLARRYYSISANMNFQYCVRMAKACAVPVMSEPRYVEMAVV